MSGSGSYKIFISYRRDDSQATVDHIYDRLKDHFGRDAIFMDVDSIPPGYSFPGYVKSVLRQCRIALIVIGPAWLSLLSNDGPYKGQPRLADPADLVRVEVEQTLALAPVNDDGRPTSDLLLTPVLVQGARMPHAEELPASLRDLAERNATQIRRNPDFDHDINRLIAHINSWTATTPAPATPTHPVSPSLPPDRFPPRLAELGFTAQKRDGIAFIVPPVCAVPADEFLMGSDPRVDHEARSVEQPQSRVAVASFFIGRFPVTLAEYICYVEHAAQFLKLKYSRNQLQKMDHPVVLVSWEDATAYAAWLSERTGQGWRLPTEAEWEIAARWDNRAGVARRYPWGDMFDAGLANAAASRILTTSPVGNYPNGASPYGVEDMAGNVWEWTSSPYTSYPYAPTDRTEGDQPIKDRILRGGSWFDSAIYARATYRDHAALGYHNDSIGFRLVMSDSA
jgi:formylglycine-generating enzyme required for sulfatase activity